MIYDYKKKEKELNKKVKSFYCIYWIPICGSSITDFETWDEIINYWEELRRQQEAIIEIISESVELYEECKPVIYDEVEYDPCLVIEEAARRNDVSTEFFYNHSDEYLELYSNGLEEICLYIDDAKDSLKSHRIAIYMDM